MSGFRVESHADQEAGSLRVIGDFDLAACEEVAGRLRAALEQRPARVTVDLSAVAFIDSAGLRTVVLLEREAATAGVEVTIIPPEEGIVDLLRPTSDVLNRLAGSNETRTAAGHLIQEIRFELPHELTSPGRARDEVREAASDLFSAEQLDVAVLLASELVSNAVRHGPNRPFEVTIGVWEDRIRLEVRDQGEGFDPLAGPASQPDPGARSGRGLAVVDSLSSRWGSQRYGDERGFLVWFELDLVRSLAPA